MKSHSNTRFLGGLLASLSIFGLSTAANAASGNLIVKFKDSARLTESNFRSALARDGLTIRDTLQEETGIYLVNSIHESVSTEALLKKLRANPRVAYAQEDHPLTQREDTLAPFLEPNDPLCKDQWHLRNTRTPGADTHAMEAWKAFGTGGQDAAGNDIVMTVVDGGMDVNHRDLLLNVWTNSEETKDGVDNDGNGYVDDIYGWSALKDTGTISASRHGTHVAGIMGAVGNNSYGVAGINWNAKLMAVEGSTSSTSVAVKAYAYVVKQKKLWIESKGKRGANVVSTNSSFGVDRADCNSSQYPAWNDMYDQMGKLGILSAVATANQGYDVDKVGDVPSACNSEYVVGVTNTTKEDKLNGGAAWGKKHIDLGAPGTDVLSLVPSNGTVTMTGTSMATPQVAGAIGYLHAVASPAFNALYLEDPARAALELKQILVSSTDEISDLKGRSVSGGRLNLLKAAQKINSFGSAE